MKRDAESGFTLVELLTVVAIIGVLASLGISSFKVYRTSAYYALISQTYGQARTAMEAGINDVDNPPALVPLTQQLAAGDIQNNGARDLLPALKLPKDTLFKVSYDPDCSAGGCVREFIEVKHCKGAEYLQWSRLGDGTDVLLEKISGFGCS